jgi:type I restriction enzyme R subunit
VDVETAFKNPKHPFRIAMVCAMWLTGFDVECLSTLYIDKPMRAHTLMQAIARANRVYPGKDFGLIVDYNGMLKSLREALAQYALGTTVAVSEKSSRRSKNAWPRWPMPLRSPSPPAWLGFDANSLLGTKGLHPHPAAGRCGGGGVHQRRSQAPL